MDVKELTNRIYDTLLGNVGMSQYHVAITPEDITNQEVFDRAGLIYLQIDNKVFELTICRINSNWFEEK